MRHVLIFLAVSGLALAGCAASDAPGTASAAAATPTDRAGFVAMAGASDLYEIQSSQLALTKGQRADVRQFGQMMIDHHTMTTQQVTTAARQDGLTPPPPQLMPMQRQMIDQLQAASGAAFDRLYVDQQLTAHQMALALHSNYAERGEGTALRGAAGQAAPIVQQHLDRLNQLRQGS